MNETQEKLRFLTLLNKFQITKILSQITKIRNYYLVWEALVYIVILFM